MLRVFSLFSSSLRVTHATARDVWIWAVGLSDMCEQLVMLQPNYDLLQNHLGPRAQRMCIRVVAKLQEDVRSLL